MDDVAKWLKANPDFFMTHADVFAAMRIPHPQGGHAISMVERQLISLRDCNAQLEMRLKELIVYGQHNDDLIEKLHRLTLALLRSPDVAITLAVLHESIRTDFDIAMSAVRWWGPAFSTESLPECVAVNDETRGYVVSLDRPYVGPNAAYETRQWLNSEEHLASSFAYVPLVDGVTQGVLMLASENEARFTPDMATDVLMRLAHLVTAALMRFVQTTTLD